ncbi:hypothetical protein [uncultured Peptoniphilus sp.]|uniref:hypothetical protein n=1 Tax=uncultured Peptoniphilus sp. TaxID=254354 RepID=UPI00259A0856|nr:hypothetical protein [uncultured Peptoniphilus sp.]
MEINVKISFEERFLGALERLVWVCNCTSASSGLKSLDEIKDTPVTAPAGTFPKGEPAQAKTENVEKAKEEVAQAPAQEAVPTETPAYTFEQIQVACANLAREGKRTELGNLIKEFGLASLPDLKEDQYNAFALKLREIGGTI